MSKDTVELTLNRETITAAFDLMSNKNYADFDSFVNQALDEYLVHHNAKQVSSRLVDIEDAVSRFSAWQGTVEYLNSDSKKSITNAYAEIKFLYIDKMIAQLTEFKNYLDANTDKETNSIDVWKVKAFCKHYPFIDSLFHSFLKGEDQILIPLYYHILEISKLLEAYSAISNTIIWLWIPDAENRSVGDSFFPFSVEGLNNLSELVVNSKQEIHNKPTSYCIVSKELKQRIEDAIEEIDL